jgi:hypothetical protein
MPPFSINDISDNTSEGAACVPPNTAHNSNPQANVTRFFTIASFLFNSGDAFLQRVSFDDSLIDDSLINDSLIYNGKLYYGSLAPSQPNVV